MSMEYKEYPLEELLIYEQPTTYIVNSTDYSDEYRIPVLTAGKSFILGYTNEENGVFDELPVIIFDDFTTATQYVDFKFKVKSSAMKILHVNTGLVLPKYIYYRLQVVQFDHSTHKRYWIQQYSKIKVSIPTLKEQHRIVARIEEMFSELEAAEGTLKKTKEQLKVYRRAALEKAFEGEYQRRVLSEISNVISGYAFKSGKYCEDGKYVVVKIGNVKQWRFDFSRDLTKTNEADNTILDKYLLKKGDCLITLTGSRGKRDYGFVSMIEDESNYLVNQRVAALRFNTEYAIPGFFKYYLSSVAYRNQFFKYETGNVGQGNVGIKALQEPKVICPPKEEQIRIMNEVETRMTACDYIERTIEETLQKIVALRQSVLKEAFEWRL